MTRLIPQHFDRRGKPKKPYAEREDAVAAGQRLKQDAYRCKFCGQYHLATRKP